MTTGRNRCRGTIPVGWRKRRMMRVRHGVRLTWFLVLVAVTRSAAAATVPQEAPDFLLTPPTLRLERPPAGQGAEPQLPGREPWKLANRTAGEWGSLDARWLVQPIKGAADGPITGDRWQTEEALKVSIAGPLFVFGQVGAGFDTL